MSRVFGNRIQAWSLGLICGVLALGRAWAEPEPTATAVTGLVRGIVVDEQGNRLVHAVITLKGDKYYRSTDSSDYTPPTDPDLDFEFSGLPAGIYQLHGMGEGIAPVAIELKDGQMVLENVRVPTLRQTDLNWRLRRAVQDERTAEVRELLAAGADPNQETWPGSLLTMAAADSDLDMVQALVTGGANVCVAPDAAERKRYQHGISDSPFTDALTPYEHALWRRLPDMATYLFAHGASTNDLLVPPPGAIRGRIETEDGQPVADLKIGLTWPNEVHGRVYRQTKTGADGTYFFPSLEPGPLAVTILGMASNPVLVARLTPETPEAEMPLLRIGKSVVPTQKLLKPAQRLGPGKIAELVAQGADVNACDLQGRTLLMQQAQYSHSLDVLRALVGNGARLDLTDADGFTAMDLATRWGQTNAIAYLLEQGAQPSRLALPPHGIIGGVLLDEQNRPLPRIPLQCSGGEEPQLWDPMIFTERDGSFRFDHLVPDEYRVRVSLIPDILLTTTLTEPESAITNAVLRCARDAALDMALWIHLQTDMPFIAEVLKAGANANRTNSGGQTALMIATENGCSRPVQALLEGGAEVNAADPGGTTALHVACRRGNTNIIAQLIAAGAKLDATNQAGRTPLDIAVWEGHEDVVQQLRALGAPGSVAESKAIGAMSGMVRDDTGAPVAGESVRCLLDGGELTDSGFGMSGRDGRYFIGELKLGTYHVQLGYDDNTWKTVVLSNRDETVAGVDFQIRGVCDPNWKLLHSSSMGDESIFQLLKQGADPNTRDPESGDTPLHRAASGSRSSDLPALLEAGACVDATNRWGQTALMVAAENGYSGHVGLLLKAGADVRRLDHMGSSALHLACKNGNCNAVKQLIEAGADLQQTNHWGRTPLDEAVWEKRPEAANMLRAAGAPGTLAAPKPDGTIRGIVVDEDGAPLRSIVLQVQRQTSGTNAPVGPAELRTLPDGSFRMGGETAGCYRFASASRLDNPVIVCLTNDWDVQNDVRVQIPRRCVQEAALFAAVAADDPKAVESLLASGADPRAVDCENRSLLEMALSQWATNVVPALLAHGADLNTPGADGRTILRRAAGDWMSWKIPYLLRQGAAVRPEEGGSPMLMLDVVRRDPGEDEGMKQFRLRFIGRCAKTARLLIGAGALVNIRDENGMTPLHYAVRNGYAECAEVLLKAGADANATNRAGQTPLAMALQSQQTNTAAELRWYGATEPSSAP